MKRTKRINWTQIVNALVLVKIGQDLGTHCQLTQSIHDVIDTLAAFLAALSKFL